jgi:hypothetical protein
MHANLQAPPEIIHRLELRESSEIRVELIAGQRCRLGVYRGSPSATDASDLILVAGFALDVAGARELRSALALAIVRLEAVVEE